MVGADGLLVEDVEPGGDAPSRSAAARARSSTTGPRETLTSTAPGRISASSRSPIIPGSRPSGDLDGHEVGGPEQVVEAGALDAEGALVLRVRVRAA